MSDDEEYSEEELRELRVTFFKSMCPYCGLSHLKTICPRIKKMTYYPNQVVKRVWFWREWVPPEFAITPGAVFGTAARAQKGVDNVEAG